MLSAWGGLASVAVSGGAGAGEEITNFAGFYALSAAESAEGRPVRFAGVALACDRDWGQFYVHDGREVRWFNPREFTTRPTHGQRVEITGTTTVLGRDHSLTNLNLTVLGPGVLPAAKPLALDQLATAFGQWVETDGRVRAVDFDRGRMELSLFEREQGCLATVLGPPQTNEAGRLLGARVRVRGINASKTADGRLDEAAVFVPGMDEITVAEPPEERPVPPRVVSIDSLLNRELGDWTNELVCISGAVISYQPGRTLTVRDPTGVLRARVVQFSPARIDDRAKVSGLLRVTPEETVLSGAWFEVLKPIAPSAGARVAPQVPARPAAERAEVLTRASEVRKLTPEESAWRRPVRLRGVVLFADTEWRIGYLQDQHASIFFDLNQSNVRAGDWVELTGETDAGGFAPDIVNATVKALGTTNLPPAARVDLGDLASGYLDAQWVEIEGVIQRASLEWGHLRLRVMTPKGRFEAVIPGIQDEAAAARLVDALASIRGACSLETNAKRQLTGVTLHVPGLDQITILEPAPPDPFALPATPISEVATFDPDRLAGRRVKVAGTVTLKSPDQGFFLQDSSGGIRVRLMHTQGIEVGDALDVLGFPALGEFSPELDEVSYRRTGSAAPPVPRPTSAEEILLQGAHDGVVVTLQARLVQSVRRAANPQLLLQDGDVYFSARLEDVRQGRDIPALESGSVVRLSGVCSIQRGEQREAKGFRLRLRSAADVVLVSASPWWTARRALWVLGGLGGVLALALVWVHALRGQVARQTRTLREQIAERERMQAQIEQTHKELVQISRQAGMAEVATGVLHNIGNVLNSVNVSANIVADRVGESRLERLADAVRILEAHGSDLAGFLRDDPKGRRVVPYLGKLVHHLGEEQATTLRELESLTKSVEHIKAILAAQQGLARVSGVIEKVSLAPLFEDALQVNRMGLERHGIRVVREFEPIPPIMADKHRILQILLNLIRNAKEAIKAAAPPDPVLYLRLQAHGADRVRLQVQDTGVGLKPEHLTSIFSHGFTTKRDGHGFGLHMGALAARQMGGTLVAESAGPGRGATFTLELPRQFASPAIPPAAS